jgi:hypothetical protein
MDPRWSVYQLRATPGSVEVQPTRQDRDRKTLGSYRDCPGTTLVVCPKILGRGSFDRVV